MRKNLEIPMEEECIDCPRLKLNTDVIYADGYETIKSHGCKHREFCRDIVHHLKEHGWRKVRKQDETSRDA